MIPALEAIDKILPVVEADDFDDKRRALADAMLATDPNDAPTLRWLAAIAIARAEEIDPS